MFTAEQIQAIFDYAMLAYTQNFKALPREANMKGAIAAAAATTCANSEAKMSGNVKNAFLSACITVVYRHREKSGTKFRMAVDKDLPVDFKNYLEKLFPDVSIKLNPNQTFLYGKNYYLLGHYRDAIVTLENAMEDDLESKPHCWYYLGKSHLFLKNHHIAQTFFSQLLEYEQDPILRADYYDSMGISWMAEGNYAEAVRCFEQAIEHNPRNCSALHNCAVAYLREVNFLKNYDKSQQLLNTIFAIEPNYSQALHTQASLFEFTEQYEKAAEYYLKAIQQWPKEDVDTLAAIKSNLTESYVEAGHNYYFKNEFDIARDFYEKAIAEDDRHYTALNQAGMCCYKQEQFSEARAYFNTLIRFTMLPDSAEDKQTHANNWLNRAVTFRKTGALNLAKGSLAMARELIAGDEDLEEETRSVAAKTIFCFFKSKKQEKPLMVDAQELPALK